MLKTPRLIFVAWLSTLFLFLNEYKMTDLFDKYPIVKERLINYLTSINENINWSEFFTKHGTLSDHKILKRIRSLLWIDKSIDYDPHIYTTVKYFEYYISLLMKFKPIFTTDRVVYIIPPKEDCDIIDEFKRDLMSKYSILKRILSIMNVKYADLDVNATINAKIEILIPLGSICYPDINHHFEHFKGIIIPDGYYNICFDKNDEIMSNFILNIKALMMSPEDVNDVYKPQYNMFFIKCSKCNI